MIRFLRVFIMFILLALLLAGFLTAARVFCGVFLTDLLKGIDIIADFSINLMIALAISLYIAIDSIDQVHINIHSEDSNEPKC